MPITPLMLLGCSLGATLSVIGSNTTSRRQRTREKDAHIPRRPSRRHIPRRADGKVIQWAGQTVPTLTVDPMRSSKKETVVRVDPLADAGANLLPRVRMMADR